ncbi:MAG: hypothetical protein WA921_03560 [Ahrensia sp.]
MKTLLITLATAATLMAGAAHAASTSSSTGDVRAFDSNPQTLFGGAALDLEPTASIGGVSEGQVFVEQQFINGREANVRYTLDGGVKNIVSKSFTASGN